MDTYRELLLRGMDSGSSRLKNSLWGESSLYSSCGKDCWRTGKNDLCRTLRTLKMIDDDEIKDQILTLRGAATRLDLLTGWARASLYKSPFSSDIKNFDSTKILKMLEDKDTERKRRVNWNYDATSEDTTERVMKVRVNLLLDGWFAFEWCGLLYGVADSERRGHSTNKDQRSLSWLCKLLLVTQLLYEFYDSFG